jgi:hypothetical protein
MSQNKLRPAVLEIIFIKNMNAPPSEYSVMSFLTDLMPHASPSEMPRIVLVNARQNGPSTLPRGLPAQVGRPSSIRLFSRTNEPHLHGVIPPSNPIINPSTHPQFRGKRVYYLHCRHCSELLCWRGMKAILLGNDQVELFSTDIPADTVQTVFTEYTTDTCRYASFFS